MAMALASLHSILVLVLHHHFSVFTTGESPPEACPKFACANGVVFRYPFWTHQIDQKPLPSHFCGYPGFNVSCNGEFPILGLMNDQYRVTKIDYHEKTIGLASNNGVHELEICPKATRGVEIPSSGLFNYTVEDKLLRFFYNCSLYPPSLQPITCLSHQTLRSFAFPAGVEPEFDWSMYCESNSTIPMMGVSGSEAAIEEDYKRWIQEGFELRWRAEEACRSCESSRGFCGYSSANTSGSGQKDFICICPDGHHRLDFCVGQTNAIKGAETTHSSPGKNAVSLVIGIGGGILIAAIAIFFMLRRKEAAAYRLVTEKRNKRRVTTTST